MPGDPCLARIYYCLQLAGDKASASKDARLTKVSYSPSYTTKYLFGSQKRKVKATTQQEIYLLLVFFFMIQLFVWIPTWRVHELTLVIEHFILQY